MYLNDAMLTISPFSQCAQCMMPLENLVDLNYSTIFETNQRYSNQLKLSTLFE